MSLTELAQDPRSRRRRQAAPSRLLWLGAVGAVLALAVVVRLGFVAATPDYRPDHDDRNYDWLAQNIARSGAYPKAGGADGPRPTAFRPPAYPYALGAVYRAGGARMAEPRRRWEAARRAQAVVGALTVALLGLLATKLWGRTRGLLAMAAAAVYPPLVLVQGSLVSEVLFVPLVLAAMLAALAHRRSPRGLRWAAAAGVLAGLATLTRTNAPVLLLPLALAVWTGRPRWSRRALSAPAALVLAAVLTVVPWTVRNAVVMGELIPLATQTGPALAGTFNSTSLADHENPGAWRLLRGVPEYRDLYLRRGELRETEMDRMMRARVRAYVAEHPEAVVRVGYWNLVRMLELGGRDRTRMAAGTIGIRPSHADVGAYAFLAAGTLALLGALTAAARRTPMWVWLVPLLLVASVLFVNTETPRFRVPVDPFVLMLAALAVAAGCERLRPRAGA